MMFNRYRIFLRNAEGTSPAGGTAAPVAAPAAAPPAPAAAAPATPPAPAPGEEFKAMTSEQFAQRLAKERESATKAVLKETGFANLDEAKTFFAKAKEAEEAKKSAEQKTAEKLAALEPLATQAEKLGKTIESYLAIEEGLVPEDKKALLDLAPAVDDKSTPEQKAARLDWIVKARAKGLFNAAAPAAAATTTPAPANSRAGNGNPPTPAPPTAGKHPREMTPEEYAKYEAQWKAQHSG